MAIQALHNEEALLSAMAKGDEESFVRVFRHYQRHIFGVAVDYVKSHALAEETVQDIFLKVWEHREKLPHLENFRNWLFITSRNHLINVLKRMAVDRDVRQSWTSEQAINDNSSDYRLREANLTELLSQIIGDLPNQQQAVFRLAREENLTYAEIAERLAISPNTVR